MGKKKKNRNKKASVREKYRIIQENLFNYLEVEDLDELLELKDFVVSALESMDVDDPGYVYFSNIKKGLDAKLASINVDDLDLHTLIRFKSVQEKDHDYESVVQVELLIREKAYQIPRCGKDGVRRRIRAKEVRARFKKRNTREKRAYDIERG